MPVREASATGPEETPSSEDGRNPQRLGLTDRKLTVEGLLARRGFPSRVRLPEVWHRYYDPDLTTRRIQSQACHTLTYFD